VSDSIESSLESGLTENHPFRPFNQPTTEPASDAGSVKSAVPGTFNPCAADELMPNATSDIIPLTAGSQLHAA
jgi:hypothetical protein